MFIVWTPTEPKSCVIWVPPRPSIGHQYWPILGRPVSQLSVDTPADSVDMSVDIGLPGVGLHEELADTSTKVSVDSVIISRSTTFCSYFIDT